MKNSFGKRGWILASVLALAAPCVAVQGAVSVTFSGSAVGTGVGSRTVNLPQSPGGYGPLQQVEVTYRIARWMSLFVDNDSAGTQTGSFTWTRVALGMDGPNSFSDSTASAPSSYTSASITVPAQSGALGSGLDTGDFVSILSSILPPTPFAGNFIGLDPTTSAQAPDNLDRFIAPESENEASSQTYTPTSFVTTNPTDLATFTGGGTVPFVTTGVIGTINNNFDTGNTVAVAVTRLYVEVDVTYTYVPEVSWTGLAAGFGLVGWAVARRRA